MITTASCKLCSAGMTFLRFCLYIIVHIDIIKHAFSENLRPFYLLASL